MTGAPKDLSLDPVGFGPFRLIARERLLLKDGQPVPLGSRALDLLIALVGNAQQPVDKRALMVRVWPDVIVDEGSLRFHVAALRKAFIDTMRDVKVQAEAQRMKLDVEPTAGDQLQAKEADDEDQAGLDGEVVEHADTRVGTGCRRYRMGIGKL